MCHFPIRFGMLLPMRFGRIATPEGMTFAVIDEAGEVAKAIAGTPYTDPESVSYTHLTLPTKA